MKKLPELNKEMWEKNQKMKDIVNEKTFSFGLKTGKEKPRLVEREEICSRRDLFKEGLAQNKVLCSSSIKLNCQ